MTVESCVNFCVSGGFIFAGLEFSQVSVTVFYSDVKSFVDLRLLHQECYCGNNIANGGTNATASDCNDPCTGDATEICGGASKCFPY